MQNSECRVQNEVTLTRAEIDALNKHSAKMKEETIKEAFAIVKGIIRRTRETEFESAEMAQTKNGEQKHQYAECMCLALLVEIEERERRLIDETDKI